jgi:glycerate dehydrogenase
MEHIVFLDRDSIHADIRRPDFAHTWRDYPNTGIAHVVERLRDATIAVSNKVPVLAEHLAKLPTLRLVAVCATGTNNVDLESCRARGLAVTNIRHYAVHTVPEHVFTLILALRRKLIAYHDDVRRGDWQRAEQFCLLTHPITDLNAGTLGIIGFGELGRAVARLGEAFGMRVLIAEHKGAMATRPQRSTFSAVLAESDIITLHCPLTPQTRHLIGAEELGQMRRHALLINAARGGLVDEVALAEALRRGTIGGAGFDVLTVEPPRQGNPLLAPDLPNFLLTPHVAWSSLDAMQFMANQLIDNIEAFVRGAKQNRVV